MGEVSVRHSFRMGSTSLRGLEVPAAMNETRVEEVATGWPDSSAAGRMGSERIGLMGSLDRRYRSHTVDRDTTKYVYSYPM